jgi:hypothetical protein
MTIKPEDWRIAKRLQELVWNRKAQQLPDWSLVTVGNLVILHQHQKHQALFGVDSESVTVVQVYPIFILLPAQSGFPSNSEFRRGTSWTTLGMSFLPDGGTAASHRPPGKQGCLYQGRMRPHGGIFSRAQPAGR